MKTTRSLFEHDWKTQGNSSASLARRTLDDVGAYDDASTQSAWVAWQRASTAQLERCAQEMELSRASILLLAGEMTAQELRTVRAVLDNRARVLRSLP